MVFSLRGFLIAMLVLCSGCMEDKPVESELHRDMAGFVLGDDEKRPQRLVVGVGESVDSFLARNPFLKRVTATGGNRRLNLPLMAKVDGHYDDGEITFDVGCSFTTNIDGNYGYVGIHDVEFQLCDPKINDWGTAIRRTMELAEEFARLNPNMRDLRAIRRAASLAETEKLWGTSLIDKITRLEFPLTEERANQFFEEKAQAGHFEQLQWRQNTYALIAGYVGDKVKVSFGISKETYWGGEDLSEEERNTMKYQTIVAFRLRRSEGTPCKPTPDGQICEQVQETAK